jgi:hypothetical protein
MSALSRRFLIAPDAAVEKFLVDMRLTAERSYGPWMEVLQSGFAKTTLSAADRRDLLKPHPLEDYFYAGLIGLQAGAVRESFTPDIAEALLRQVALKVDEATGRSDRIISNMVFIIFGRIRKNGDLGLRVAPQDVVTDVILERLAIDRMKGTRQLMNDPAFRRALNAPFTKRAIWWNAFQAIYMVNVTAQPHARRTRAGAREYFATRRTPQSMVFERAGQQLNEDRPSSVALSSLAQKLGQWLTPRPHVH